MGPKSRTRRPSRLSWVTLASVLTALLAGACGPAKPDAKEAAIREAQDVWQNRCANCHGNLGAGDGPGAAGLDPKPRNFQSPQWQAGVDDAHIKKVIVGGGAAVGMSPSMAPNPDLDGKDALLDALVLKVRKLQK